MRKRIISAIIAATITLLPTAALAASIPGDVDGDGVLSYEDVNLINASIERGENRGEEYDFNKDGKVDIKDILGVVKSVKPTGIRGDLNDDGVVSLEDYNLARNVYFSSERGIIYGSNGAYVKVSYVIPDTSKYCYDVANADVDQDGYITLNETAALLMEFKLESTNIKGDVNGDKVVNNKDLILLKNYLLDSDNFRISRANADYNNDNKITVLDYTSIQHVIVNN